MKVYVSKDKKTVISKERYDVLISQNVAELLEDPAVFEDFLGAEYSIADVFKMSPEKKAEVLLEFKQYCIEVAEDEMRWEYDFTEAELYTCE